MVMTELGCYSLLRPCVTFHDIPPSTHTVGLLWYPEETSTLNQQVRDWTQN